MFQRIFAKLILAALAFSGIACQNAGNLFQPAPASVAPAALRDVPAVKFNFRFETDVPAPPANAVQTAQTEERNAAVQNDFDQNRPQETIDKTIASPDKQRILAVYHKIEDLPAEFRIDVYTADGKLIRKITPDAMAVHFAETIVWSPDSTTFAFVAMARVPGAAGSQPSASPTPAAENTSASANTSADANTNAENANTENVNAGNTNATVAPTPAPAASAPSGVMTFRTEQIYVCSSDGADLKTVTQNEGLIYFYFVWSPDSSSLAALAATYQEWNFYKQQADLKGEIFIPAGRLRLIERTGRERRLDDNPTNVRPVWSPDSAKVGGAFGTQVRIYDAVGDAPTQAAIQLRNQLLISSKAYDEREQSKEQNAATNANSNANASANANANQAANANTANQPIGSLPDESTLVSFNPVINLEWTEDKMLYAQTGYLKQMKNEGDTARSFLRWHRLIFSPQPTALR